MKKICKTCQYFRLVKVDAPRMPKPPWCSNSKSEHHMQSMKETDGCKAWVRKIGTGLLGKLEKK